MKIHLRNRIAYSIHGVRARYLTHQNESSVTKQLQELGTFHEGQKLHTL